MALCFLRHISVHLSSCLRLRLPHHRLFRALLRRRPFILCSFFVVWNRSITNGCRTADQSSVTRSAHTRDGPHPTSVLNQIGISTSHHRSLSESRTPLTVQEPVPPIPTARISHDEYRKLLKSSSPSLLQGLPGYLWILTSCRGSSTPSQSSTSASKQGLVMQ